MTNDRLASAFTTSFGRTIPAAIMAKVVARLTAGVDWQDVASQLLRPIIPDHEEDLEEVNEVLRNAEARIDVASVDDH